MKTRSLNTPLIHQNPVHLIRNYSVKYFCYLLWSFLNKLPDSWNVCIFSLKLEPSYLNCIRVIHLSHSERACILLYRSFFILEYVEYFFILKMDRTSFFFLDLENYECIWIQVLSRFEIRRSSFFLNLFYSYKKLNWNYAVFQNLVYNICDKGFSCHPIKLIKIIFNSLELKFRGLYFHIIENKNFFLNNWMLL